MMNVLDAGDSLLDVVGPLGKPSDIERYGHCVVIGGGVGTAIALPIAQALHDAGNRVTAILGARTKDLLLLEREVREACDALFVMTDDGSYGEQGLVTHKLLALLAEGAVDYVLAIGPVPMMRAVAEATRPLGIRTVVSLNSIMVDGTGMCGGCRVLVGNTSKFACVDGPEFDAHEVDFQVLMQRNAMYREQEQLAMARFHEEHHA
jgi:ferredoxin--NADP+ reductase